MNEHEQNIPQRVYKTRHMQTLMLQFILQKWLYLTVKWHCQCALHWPILAANVMSLSGTVPVVNTKLSSAWSRSMNFHQRAPIFLNEI